MFCVHGAGSGGCDASGDATINGMSFLDNLENNLKSLESRDEAGPGDIGRRDRERALALAAAPWAERLRKEPFAQKLMQLATIAGRQRRTKVNLAWLGANLRLEASGYRLELRPGAKGITAVFMRGAEDLHEEPLDLASNPEKLITAWMTEVEERKRLDAEQVAAVPEEDLE